MDISWTWLGIVVLALIIFACASGFRRGFVKEIVSAFFMIISFLLVWVISRGRFLDVLDVPSVFRSAAYLPAKYPERTPQSSLSHQPPSRICRF